MNTNTTTKNPTMLNGVNVDHVVATMNEIKEKPMLAKFTFRSDNTWLTGGHNRSSIKGFYGYCVEDDSRREAFTMDNDEPPVLFGDNRGPNPVEFILHGLAGCLTTTLVCYASAMGVKIDEIMSHYEGDIDIRGLLGLSDDVRNGYDNIRVTFFIKSDAPREKLQELVDIAKAHSPVFDVVSNGTPVAVRLSNE
ncbi:OsmC family protein [bacterium]|nr:OsmC family protein [bacterium]